MKPTLAPIAIAILLAACSSAEPPPRDRDKALQRAIEAPQDKARAVEAQLQQDARRKREAIDDDGE
jgi:hypothetical protein